MIFKIQLVIALVFITVINLYSQSGISFNELASKLSPYFAKEQIEDVRKQLPESDSYKIWGWDVGDYSQDGYYDLALSIKLTKEKNKISNVLLFIDLQGFLTKVAEFTDEFIQLPLEIGVSIRYNTCYITKKNKENNWLIKGYTFENGALILKEKYETKRLGKYTYEKLEDFRHLRNTEKFLLTTNGETVFSINYLTLPSYPRNKLIYWGHQSEIYSNYIDYIVQGSYWWKGDEDCSYSVKSSYDDKFLYFTVKVKDDEIVYQKCDTCLADNVQVWFDVSYKTKLGKRIFDFDGDKLIFRKDNKKGMYSFSLYPGDFLFKKAYVKEIKTTDILYKFQTKEIQSIKVASSLTEDGYLIKFKIPFILLAMSGPLTDSDQMHEIGCSFVVTDVDNEFRPEEVSYLSTSILNHIDPSSYGTLVFIPPKQWYDEVINVYKLDILQTLNTYGF